ncbi:hypothetical protein MUB04_14850 [Acinetobacter indicus]|uniref:hypothetical protein n=1 Tax=Acinetobacter TaxID=469 RepID=UPI0015D0D296|nr:MULTISPECIES: hypothetical protein [Acinetobacter]MCP0917812.1 hypothetical protein [Acinetobacter indicus]
MSETLLHGIPRWGVKQCPVLESYQNSHGSAPVIWNFLTQRFLNKSSYHLLDEDKELWGLSKRSDVPKAYQQVMKMTYDYAVILSEDIPQAIADIETILKEFPLPTNRVNHWAQIAEDLQKHNTKGKYVGFGFCMTSIGDSFFYGEEYIKNGKYLRHRIDWRGKGFWNIYKTANK